MKKGIRLTTIVLLCLPGANTICGGQGLGRDPSGESMQMPITFLEDSPFDD